MAIQTLYQRFVQGNRRRSVNVNHVHPGELIEEPALASSNVNDRPEVSSEEKKRSISKKASSTSRATTTKAPVRGTAQRPMPQKLTLYCWQEGFGGHKLPAATMDSETVYDYVASKCKVRPTFDASESDSDAESVTSEEGYASFDSDMEEDSATLRAQSSASSKPITWRMP
mmetsp:Transcript_14896/g.28910  ORF Transcript_14896/g.28910 Transcript_14896/m.28910 type:complete len:171 (-) Transcript_14896:99-611(-)|eukprot:CAMPEP_0171491944 /NCGR_PEP_ID=MMETSP0958-20121227/4139_1 /TAXON_ID=87120 /ORGANISM="Aurantiochytrium limacinum, Strain ATCCMYA-1381" /LENGTH=170 /DNA_ID=CAMNT_0012025415 /DNA_START=32 /DNA_END=544 /DNA_ORIENTATION=+